MPQCFQSAARRLPTGNCKEYPSCQPEYPVPKPQQQRPTHVEVHVASWNIGSTSIEDAVQSTRRADGPKKDFLCLQEVPRQPTGWKTTVVDDMTVVQYRHDDEQWRGNAIAFSADYQILRRRGCRYGLWLRLRHLPTGNEIWMGSTRLSTGCTSDVTAEERDVLVATRDPPPYHAARRLQHTLTMVQGL